MGVVATSSNHSGNVLSKAFAQGFDLIYKRVATKEKTCDVVLEEDLFDGRLFTSDEFYRYTEPFFDNPSEFYKTFKSVDSLNLRSGLHPAQGNWKAYKHEAKAMLFDTPLESAYEVNNLVPFRWFTDEQRKSDTLILFVPGWARESQGFEEKMCAQLKRLGVDVGLVTKPYHQARTPQGAKSGEYFISANLYWTVRNFQQLVAELRLLIQYMKQHYSRIGLFGMSSGGFQSCLAANCEEVDFLFCFMTGCNLWDITWHGLITNHIKADVIAKGLSKEDVRKVWSICDEGVLGHNNRAKLKKHYITLYDQVVMPECQFELWRALGKNQKIELPAAHYSGALVAKKVIADVAALVTSTVQGPLKQT
jgi:hypothetical protein